MSTNSNVRILHAVNVLVLPRIGSILALRERLALDPPQREMPECEMAAADVGDEPVTPAGGRFSQQTTADAGVGIGRNAMRSRAMKLAGLVGAAALFAVAAVIAMPEGTASADHRHVVHTPAGCVILAPADAEPRVQLPEAVRDQNPNVGGWGANTHPLHVLVHMGRPGQQLDIATEAQATDPVHALFCSSGFINE